MVEHILSMCKVPGLIPRIKNKPKNSVKISSGGSRDNKQRTGHTIKLHMSKSQGLQDV